MDPHNRESQLAKKAEEVTITVCRNATVLPATASCARRRRSSGLREAIRPLWRRTLGVADRLLGSAWYPKRPLAATCATRWRVLSRASAYDCRMGTMTGGKRRWSEEEALLGRGRKVNDTRKHWSNLSGHFNVST